MPWVDDFICEDCGVIKEHLSMNQEERGKTKSEGIECPTCKKTMEFVMVKPPSGSSIGKEGSDTSIRAFQQKCKERFVKKELDDVRHKFGRNFDDSLVSSAAKRIKEGKV